MILVGLFLPLGGRTWVDSRNTRPVDTHALFDPGQTQKISFHTNFRATYWVEILLEDAKDDHAELCSPGPLPLPSWSLTREQGWFRKRSELWASSSSGFRWVDRIGLDGFRAPSGAYELEMVFPKGTECLKERHPRVVIQTYDLEALGEVGDLLSGLFHYFAVVGLAFVPWAFAIWICGRFSREGPRIFPGIKPGNHLQVLRQRPMRMITELPNFGLMFGAVLWILALIFMVNLPPPSSGLLIELGANEVVGLAKSPWPETISVYLGIGEKYYVNGQPVAQGDLRARLQEKLGRSAVWTVYFEADGDTLNANAIYAIDTIRGLGAKLVWITPQVRKRLRQKQAGVHKATY